jgi:5'-3' exonuclease
MEPTFIFIDGSYYCFHRYHSLLTWWKNAFPDNLDCLNDPIQNPLFVEKFRKTFVENIEKIPKNLKINKSINPILYAAKDCKRENIWRTELFPMYKANRDNSPANGFMGGPFFKMVYEENLFIQGGAKALLKHSKLEADDCIALSVKHALITYPNCNIYIITSDKDYLQLAQHNVHLYNLAFKKITDQKSCTGDAKCDLFCKIISGDPSDNIPSAFPKCGPKTALKYYANNDLLESKLNESPLFRQTFELNQTLVDFRKIPDLYANEFLNSFIIN